MFNSDASLPRWKQTNSWPELVEERITVLHDKASELTSVLLSTTGYVDGQAFVRHTGCKIDFPSKGPLRLTQKGEGRLAPHYLHIVGMSFLRTNGFSLILAPARSGDVRNIMPDSTRTPGYNHYSTYM
jgi:hypothetical protein